MRLDFVNRELSGSLDLCGLLLLRSQVSDRFSSHSPLQRRKQSVGLATKKIETYFRVIHESGMGMLPTDNGVI